MNAYPPSDEQIRELLTKAPKFEWPTFDHMPLNCFDLTSAVLTFPGDISESREDKRSGFADYKIDINDLNTCPKKDEIFDIELWNEKSLTVRWFFGLLRWACMVDAGDFVLKQGFFRAGIAVARFQNIEGVIDLTDIKQLKYALLRSLVSQVENGDIQSIQEEKIFTKIINDKSWVIARSLNPINNPAYSIVSAIDHQTAILIHATLANSWFYDELLPDDIEQKHLASFWDFLGHIHLSHTREANPAVGSIIREAPGQAERDDLPEW